MRILGIGSDIVHIPRIEALLARFGVRFEERIFSATERKIAATLAPQKRAAFYAKRFAAREAFAKALGTGFRNGFFPRHLSVQNDALGKPSLHPEPVAEKLLHKHLKAGEKAEIHLSLSDDYPIAQAFVVLAALR